MLKDRPEVSVETILKGNDKLTRFYMGIPTYDSFAALVDYLEPKALQLTAWRSDKTSASDSLEGRGSFSQCFSSLAVANQLLAVFIRLRRELEAYDVCIRFKISETTYTCMLTTWTLFFVMNSIPISFKTKIKAVDAKVFQ